MSSEFSSLRFSTIGKLPPLLARLQRNTGHTLPTIQSQVEDEETMHVDSENGSFALQSSKSALLDRIGGHGHISQRGINRGASSNKDHQPPATSFQPQLSPPATRDAQIEIAAPPTNTILMVPSLCPSPPTALPSPPLTASASNHSSIDSIGNDESVSTSFPLPSRIHTKDQSSIVSIQPILTSSSSSKYGELTPTVTASRAPEPICVSPSMKRVLSPLTKLIHEEQSAWEEARSSRDEEKHREELRRWHEQQQRLLLEQSTSLSGHSNGSESDAQRHARAETQKDKAVKTVSSAPLSSSTLSHPIRSTIVSLSPASAATTNPTILVDRRRSATGLLAKPLTVITAKPGNNLNSVTQASAPQAARPICETLGVEEGSSKKQKTLHPSGATNANRNNAPVNPVKLDSAPALTVNRCKEVELEEMKRKILAEDTGRISRPPASGAIPSANACNKSGKPNALAANTVTTLSTSGKILSPEELTQREAELKKRLGKAVSEKPSNSPRNVSNPVHDASASLTSARQRNVSQGYAPTVSRQRSLRSAPVAHPFTTISQANKEDKKSSAATIPAQAMQQTARVFPAVNPPVKHQPTNVPPQSQLSHVAESKRPLTRSPPSAAAGNAVTSSKEPSSHTSSLKRKRSEHTDVKAESPVVKRRESPPQKLAARVSDQSGSKRVKHETLGTILTIKKEEAEENLISLSTVIPMNSITQGKPEVIATSKAPGTSGGTETLNNTQSTRHELNKQGDDMSQNESAMAGRTAPEAGACKATKQSGRTIHNSFPATSGSSNLLTGRETTREASSSGQILHTGNLATEPQTIREVLPSKGQPSPRLEDGGRNTSDTALHASKDRCGLDLHLPSREIQGRDQNIDNPPRVDLSRSPGKRREPEEIISPRIGDSYVPKYSPRRPRGADLYRPPIIRSPEGIPRRYTGGRGAASPRRPYLSDLPPDYDVIREYDDRRGVVQYRPRDAPMSFRIQGREVIMPQPEENNRNRDDQRFGADIHASHPKQTTNRPRSPSRDFSREPRHDRRSSPKNALNSERRRVASPRPLDPPVQLKAVAFNEDQVFSKRPATAEPAPAASRPIQEQSSQVLQERILDPRKRIMQIVVPPTHTSQGDEENMSPIDIETTPPSIVAPLPSQKVNLQRVPSIPVEAVSRASQAGISNDSSETVGWVDLISRIATSSRNEAPLQPKASQSSRNASHGERRLPQGVNQARAVSVEKPDLASRLSVDDEAPPSRTSPGQVMRSEPQQPVPVPHPYPQTRRRPNGRSVSRDMSPSARGEGVVSSRSQRQQRYDSQIAATNATNRSLGQRLSDAQHTSLERRIS